MAAVVSHAMRRYPTSPSDTTYSSYRFRGEERRSESPVTSRQGGQSALSRSMRYAEPWLYGGGTVRGPPPGGLILTPALALCVCPDYLNGTKRSKKHHNSPIVCKKCKGTRLPLTQLDHGGRKFGTVRCYPTFAATPVPLTPSGGGTVRVSTSSSRRPSILPSDPYDLVRRSRLEGGSPTNGNAFFRPRSTSPKKGRRSDEGTTTQKGIAKPESYNSTIGRRSILECDINPYELVSSTDDAKLVESSITLVNGQRIRVRPSLVDQDYEDVQIRKSPKSNHSSKSPIETTKKLRISDIKPSPTKLPTKPKSQAGSPRSPEKEPDFSNRFKSILKKPSTFSDTDSESQERSLSPTIQKSSQFYLPMPTPARKKVQFLVEKEYREPTTNGKELGEEKDSSGDDDVFEDAKSVMEEPDVFEDAISKTVSDPEKNAKKPSKLHRSLSDRVAQEQRRVVFHDTMALRQRKTKSETRINFTDLERLDGTITRSRKISPRPQQAPPPPPNVNNVENINGYADNSVEIEKDVDETEDCPSISTDLENVVANKSSKEVIFSIPNSIKDISNVNSEKVVIEQFANSEENDSIIVDDNHYEKFKIKKTEQQNTRTFNTNDHKNCILEEENVTETNSDSKFSDIVKENNSINAKNDSFKKRISLTENNSSNQSDKVNTLTIKNFNEQVALERLDKCLKDEKYEHIFLTEEAPPSAPPRKKSNNKILPINITNGNSKLPILSPSIHKVRIESPCSPPPIDFSNKTIVQINTLPSPQVHKIQIKNDFSEHNNLQTISVVDNPQRKTSILINGDDCYSTVNVNDNVPLYQSSVVVNESVVEIRSPSKKSSTIYITGAFLLNDENQESKVITKDSTSKNCDQKLKMQQEQVSLVDSFSEQNIPSSDMLKELLRDPVEAVRRNLVPHVCGKSDMSRRPRGKKLIDEVLRNSSENDRNKPLEETFLRSYESIGDDVSSEHSSSTHYEPMDPGSDCYTDNSNRSSVTEEEMAHRTKFYELLADSALVEVSENEDHHYESIKMDSDPIYEEIEIPPPLPSNPPPSSLLDDLNLDKEFTTRSIFEGASKYDILSYLVDAKERGIVQEDSYTYNFGNSTSINEEESKESYNRVSEMSTVSDSSEDNSLIISGALIEDKATFQKTAEIERNDSGVGSETSKSSLSKYRTKPEISVSCEDCEMVLDLKPENEPLICRKCLKKRSERKEIITEIVETEEKYSRDLQIILEEFYQPMLVAGLLTPDQLSAIFLNVEELLENSQALAERLRDAVEIAPEQGDDDLLTVNMGKLFLEATPMLHAFETYCVRQGAASLLLASLEKEKELLRIFLRVSQMENTMLRRMNLNSFLMVPVQRVTKYPLLLARLYKVTPPHLDHKEELKEAQHKIELHLNHMNSQTKDVPSKLWRRIGSSSGRRSSAEMDLVNIKLRKIAVDVLEWNHEEAKFILEGKLLFTQPTDNNWRKGRTIKLSPINALLVTNGNPPMNKSADRTEENGLIFAKNGLREAALLLVRDKNGRYSLLREPLYLDRCVIAADPSWQSYFEVQELLGKDTFIFKAEDEEQTQVWYKQLQLHAQGMGAWRKRRNALANIMINGMGLRS